VYSEMYESVVLIKAVVDTHTVYTPVYYVGINFICTHTCTHVWNTDTK
jgi:hypothetical protein